MWQPSNAYRHSVVIGLLLYIYSTSSILTGNSQLLPSSLLMEVLLTGNVQCSQHGDSLDIVIILVLYCNLTWSALHLKACSSIGQIHQHSNVRWPRRVRSRVAAWGRGRGNGLTLLDFGHHTCTSWKFSLGANFSRTDPLPRPQK